MKKGSQLELLGLLLLGQLLLPLLHQSLLLGLHVVQGHQTCWARDNATSQPTCGFQYTDVPQRGAAVDSPTVLDFSSASTAS